MADLNKVYPVEKVGEKFLIRERIESDLKPKFLAINPENNELFLLLGDFGTYSLLKGNAQKGLRFCKPLAVQNFLDCFAIAFEQDDNFGVIADPHLFPRQKPMCEFGGTIFLDIVPFEIQGGE